MYIFISVNMYATRRCTHGVPTVYPYPQYPWLTQPKGRRVRVLTGTGTGQPGITRGLPVLIPKCGAGPGRAGYLRAGLVMRGPGPTKPRARAPGPALPHARGLARGYPSPTKIYFNIKKLNTQTIYDTLRVRILLLYLLHH